MKRLITNLKKQLIKRLQKLYDDNKLSDKDEITILDTIEFLGSEEDLNW